MLSVSIVPTVTRSSSISKDVLVAWSRIPVLLSSVILPPCIALPLILLTVASGTAGVSVCAIVSIADPSLDLL